MSLKYKQVYGGSILSFVEDTIGSIENIDNPFTIDYKLGVKAYVAGVRKDRNYKVLFTSGLFAHSMKECFIVLPSSWILRQYNFKPNFLQKSLTEAPWLPETFPIDILTEIVKSSTRKNSKFIIEEGVFLDKSKKPWSKMNWNDELTGMVMIDYYWDTPPDKIGKDTKSYDTGSKQCDIDNKPYDTDNKLYDANNKPYDANNKPYDTDNKLYDVNINPCGKETVSLFTIAPVCESKKSLNADWFNSRRSVDWSKFALPIFSDILLVEKMNNAMLSKKWYDVSDIIDQGINVNRGVYDPYSHWGDVVGHTYLEEILWYKNTVTLAQKFVEHGAKISPETMPYIAGSGDLELFEYFLKLGCDINAVDNVGYTCLNRAIATDHKELISRLISLGAIYIVQPNNDEVLLKELSEMGVNLQYSKK